MPLVWEDNIEVDVVEKSHGRNVRGLRQEIKQNTQMMLFERSLP